MKNVTGYAKLSGFKKGLAHLIVILTLILFGKNRPYPDNSARQVHRLIQLRSTAGVGVVSVDDISATKFKCLMQQKLVRKLVVNYALFGSTRQGIRNL